MANRKIFQVIQNKHLTDRTMIMHLSGDTSDFTAPGQFVNIEIPGKFLRRPISVCDYDYNNLTLLYDIVGEGTEILSHYLTGDHLDILNGLGNGFSLDCPSDEPLLLGGGIGIAPLLKLAIELRKIGKRPRLVLGFNNRSAMPVVDVFLRSGFNDIVVATVDGSAGTKGFVTDAIREHNLPCEYFYACGPTPMLRALCENLDFPGELSLDERMGCGFGACVCCSVELKSGVARICKEGPVFKKDELIWK